MIKIIAFDFGDVLVKDTLKAIETKYWTDAVPLHLQDKFRRAKNAIDTGKMPERLLAGILQQTLTPHWTHQRVVDQLKASRILPPWKLAEQLRKQYPIAILTNNHRSGPRIFAKLLGMDLSPYTIINSAMIGVRKPHRNFYTAALKRLKIKPEEIVFIDDIKANIPGAQAAGIKAFQYNNNMPELRRFLKKNGVVGF